MKTYDILVTGKLNANKKKVAMLIAKAGKYKKKISIEETAASMLKDFKRPAKLKK